MNLSLKPSRGVTNPIKRFNSTRLHGRVDDDSVQLFHFLREGKNLWMLRASRARWKLYGKIKTLTRRNTRLYRRALDELAEKTKCWRNWKRRTRANGISVFYSYYPF